jgi:hypothetical protein
MKKAHAIYLARCVWPHLNERRWLPSQKRKRNLKVERLRGYCRHAHAKWAWPTMQRLLKTG